MASVKEFHKNHSDSGARVRSFIALSVPQPVKDFLKGLQGNIKASGIKASWSRIETQHLTLAFLGDRSPEEIRQAQRAMEQAAMNSSSFTLSAGGVGVFPSVKKARVFWCGVHGDHDALMSLQQSLVRQLNVRGITLEARRFSPHLTLGRFHAPPRPERAVGLIQEFQDRESPPFLCAAIRLYASRLTKAGAEHSLISSAEL